MVKTALQTAFAADGHGEHGIKGLAGEPRWWIGVEQPSEHGGELAVAVVFPCVQQGGDGGGVFGARPKGGIGRRMVLAVAAQGLVHAEFAAARAKLLRVGEERTQLGLAGDADGLRLDVVADKAALAWAEHGIFAIAGWLWVIGSLKMGCGTVALLMRFSGCLSGVGFLIIKTTFAKSRYFNFWLHI